MPYWPLGIWFLLLALSMGWIMGPATGSVMSSVPAEKSGVASAMNDVTREVGGALGTAVIGSLITSLYATKIGGAAAGLPDSAQSAVRDSIGQAQAVAASLPASMGTHLSQSASIAFTDAIGIGFLVAAGTALLAAAAVRRWLPDDTRASKPTKAHAAALEAPAEAAAEPAAA
jgi:predicted MFS family arabinose efflux permease